MEREVRDVDNNELLDRNVRSKPVRSPYGELVSRRKLHTEGEDPNFHYHWILSGDPDRPARFSDALDFGFIPVMTGEVKFMGNAVKTKEGYLAVPAGKGGAKLVYCKMPKEIYKYHMDQLQQFNDNQLNSKVSAIDKKLDSELNVPGKSYGIGEVKIS